MNTMSNITSIDNVNEQTFNVCCLAYAYKRMQMCVKLYVLHTKTLIKTFSDDNVKKAMQIDVACVEGQQWHRMVEHVITVSGRVSIFQLRLLKQCIQYSKQH